MQKTKKNWTLRVAGLALAFTLVSTSLLGGTLAKYVSTVNGSDEARVAKWIDGTSLTINLFDGTDSHVFLTTGKNVGTDGKKLVAPGTSGSYTFSLNDATFGVAEVDYTVSIK